MAKYKAASLYVVEKGDTKVKFNYFGDYETNDAKEIEVLDSLVPAFVKRIDEPKPKVETEQSKQTEEIENKAPVKQSAPKGRKGNAKSSAK